MVGGIRFPKGQSDPGTSFGRRLRIWVQPQCGIERIARFRHPMLVFQLKGSLFELFSINPIHHPD